MPIAGIGKALRGFGKALKKTMDSKKTGDVLEVGVVSAIPAAMVAGELKHRKKKKKKSPLGQKKYGGPGKNKYP